MNDNQDPKAGLPKNFRLIAGLGVVAVAIAGLTALLTGRDTSMLPEPPVVTETEAEASERTIGDRAPAASEREAIARICHPELIETPTNCLEGDQLGDASAFMAGGAFGEEGLTMAGPDAGDERVVRDCDSFAELRRAGWSGLSSAAMAREGRAYRRCGLALVLAEARGAGEPAEPLEAEALARIPAADWPQLGEIGPPAAMTFVQQSATPPVWMAETDSVILRIQALGTAEFDGDPDAEHLVDWGMRAKGGTLSASGYGLIEAGEPAFRTVDPFGR